MEIINTFKQNIATFSTAQPSSSVAKHKLPRDTKKQQDSVLLWRRKKLLTNIDVGETETMLKDRIRKITSRFQYILIQKAIPSTISDLQE
jgi:hypothetical protein